MRKLLIGKQVKFRVEYAVASIGREFGQVYVGDDNASLESVANGWAKVRQGGGDQASNHEEIVAAEAGAQAAGIGLWTKDPKSTGSGTDSDSDWFKHKHMHKDKHEQGA